MTTKKNSALHTFTLFLTALIWGLAFTAQVEGAKSMGSFTFGGVRFALGAVSLLPVILIFERKKGTARERKDTLRYGLVTGVVLFLASSFQQLGIGVGEKAGYTDTASKAGFITGLYIILVPLFGLFFKHKTTAGTWVGVAAALGGLFCLGAPNGFGAVRLPEVLLMIAAVWWAAHILVIDRFAGKYLPLRFSLVQFVVCAALNLLCMVLFEQPTLIGIRSGILPIFYGGIMSVGIAYTLQIIGQQKVPPGKAAIIFSLESLFAAVGGMLLLHERLDSRGYLGCGLIFLGMLCAQIPPRKSKKPDEVCAVEIPSETLTAKRG